METELADEVANVLDSPTPRVPAGGLADLNFRLLTEAHTKAHPLPGVRHGAYVAVARLSKSVVQW